MRKYGDLTNVVSDLDNVLISELQEIFNASADKNFDTLWTNFLTHEQHEMDLRLVSKERFEHFNADLVCSESMIFAMFESVTVPYRTSVEPPQWSDFEQLDNNLTYYEQDLSVLKNDVWRCVFYNICYDKRHDKLTNKDDFFLHFSNRLDVIKESDGYNLPFSFDENDYMDFCYYTWSALIKNKEAINLFRVSDRFNPNKTSILNIGKSFAPNKDEYIPFPEMTQNDIWLVEKITGFGIANSLASLASGIDNGVLDHYNLEKHIVPIIKELVLCKPIQIRLALSDLSVKYINDVLVKNGEACDNIYVNDLLKGEEIEKLRQRINQSVVLINRRFTTICKTLYELYSEYDSGYEALRKDMIEDTTKVTGNVVLVDKKADMEEALKVWTKKEVCNRYFKENLFINVKGGKWDSSWSLIRKKSSAENGPSALFAYMQMIILQEIHNQYFEGIPS